MNTLRRALIGFVGAMAVLLCAGAFAGDPAAKPGRFIVSGDVEQRLKLHVADLTKLPQKMLTVSFLSGSSYQTHSYTGPLLLDVLNMAKPEFDAAIKNDKLRHFVVVTGSDGYQVAVAW